MREKLGKIKESVFSLWRKGAFHIMAGNFATKFVTFFGSIVLARTLLTKTEYGLLSYMENICSFAYVFAGFGMSYALLRYSILADTTEKKYSYYKYTIIKSFLFNLLLVGIMLVFNHFYDHPHEYALAGTLIPIMILALPFQQGITDNLMNERAMFNNKRYAVIAFVSSTFIVLARVFGAEIDGLKGVVWGIVLINVFFGVTILISEYKRYFYKVKEAVLTKAEKKTSSGYAIQYMITNSLWAMFMLVDTFLIGRMIADPTVLADYKIAYVFPGNMAIISSAIGIFVGPYFVRHEDDRKWIRTNFIKTFVVTAIMILLAVMVLYVFTPFIIKLCYGPKYANVVGLMRLLLVSCFINCGLRFTTANTFSAMGMVKYNMIVSFLGLMMQVILDIIMIPRFGTYGVAVTGIISYSFMAIALFVIFNKKYSIISLRKKSDE